MDDFIIHFKSEGKQQSSGDLVQIESGLRYPFLGLAELMCLIQRLEADSVE